MIRIGTAVWSICFILLWPIGQVHAQEDQTAGDTNSQNSSSEQADSEFQRWLQSFIDEARAAGISDAIINQTLVNVTPIQRVVDNDRNQAEFVETYQMYLDRRVTDWRIQTGRERLAQHREILEQVAAEYGVPARIIVAIWGIETNYGNFTGGEDVIQALVTLAYDPRRADFFRNELMQALRILQEGHITHADMKGSWAGAMGQSQFMPSSFRQYAVDFNDDGRRDIWTTEADVFASIANYLREAGWQPGIRWGREIQLPGDYESRQAQWQQPADVSYGCSRLRVHSIQQPVTEWQANGFRRVDGSSLPQSDIRGSIVRPDDDTGPTFLTYDNFRAILSYNCANNYALAVAHLADSY